MPQPKELGFFPVLPRGRRPATKCARVNTPEKSLKRAQHAAPLPTAQKLVWRGHQEGESVYGVSDFAVACGERLYCVTADFFDRG